MKWPHRKGDIPIYPSVVASLPQPLAPRAPGCATATRPLSPRRLVRPTWAALLLGVAVAVPLGAEEAPGAPNFYKFRIESVGKQEIEFLGELSVDGRTERIEGRKTPYEFRCEAATRLRGDFRSLVDGRWLRIRAYLPAVSVKKPISRSKGSRIRFYWDSTMSRTKLSIAAEQPD